MARVLFLTQVLPYPLDAGPKVRAYHMLQHLAQQHEITLVSFVRDDDAPEAVAHLQHHCAAVHTVKMRRSAWRNLSAGVQSLWSGEPLLVRRDDIGEMKHLLIGLAQRQTFDIIHADQLSMAGYGQLAARAAEHRPRTVLDEHNAVYLLVERMIGAESSPLRRALAAREARAFARYEAAMCRAYDAIFTVTEQDCQRLTALLEADERERYAARFSVIPICADADQTPLVPRVRGGPPTDGGPPTVLHLGTMFWPPNVTGVLWFAREIWPAVAAAVPDARLVIVGKRPPPEIEALAQNPQIEVTGYVPDPQPYLAAADVFIVPLLAGGGMRVKILDAWLWGVPIVSTTIGAEGIDARDGDTLLLADDPARFAEAVVRLLRDDALNQQLRQRGRAWVEAHYDWPVVYRRVDEVYARLLAQ